MSGPPFTMSKYASETDLLRDKCAWLTADRDTWKDRAIGCASMLPGSTVCGDVQEAAKAAAELRSYAVDAGKALASILRIASEGYSSVGAVTALERIAKIVTALDGCPEICKGPQEGENAAEGRTMAVPRESAVPADDDSAGEKRTGVTAGRDPRPFPCDGCPSRHACLDKGCQVDGYRGAAPTFHQVNSPTPEGWALVPLQPTPLMLRAAHFALANHPTRNNEVRAGEVWTDMIGAAPVYGAPTSHAIDSHASDEGHQP